MGHRGFGGNLETIVGQSWDNRGLGYQTRIINKMNSLEFDDAEMIMVTIEDSDPLAACIIQPVEKYESNPISYPSDYTVVSIKTPTYAEMARRPCPDLPSPVPSTTPSSPFGKSTAHKTKVVLKHKTHKTKIKVKSSFNHHHREIKYHEDPLYGGHFVPEGGGRRSSSQH